MSGDRAIGRYAAPAHWAAGVQIAVVVDPVDPDNLGRVQVVIPAIDPRREAPVWARVATAFAGDNYGAFFIPDKGAEVLVVFTAGDTTFPVVIGNLWNGATEVPEAIAGRQVDRWTLTGRNGTRIAIVEESQGQEKVEITTPAGVTALLTDAGGGEIKLEAAGNTVRLSASGVSIETQASVTVQASRVSVTAGQVSVEAGMSRFSGVVQCDTLISNSVVSTTYSPGAGNVW